MEDVSKRVSMGNSGMVRLENEGWESDLSDQKRRVRRSKVLFIRTMEIAWVREIPCRSVVAHRVGYLLWGLSGLQKSSVVKISYTFAKREFGMGRRTVYRGLKLLESAGLVKVMSKKGCASRVHILSEWLEADLRLKRRPE